MGNRIEVICVGLATETLRLKGDGSTAGEGIQHPGAISAVLGTASSCDARSV